MADINQKRKSTSKKGKSQKTVNRSLITLSERQKKDVKDAFDLFDVEGSGIIKIDEVRIPLRALGFEPTKDDMRKIKAEYDKEGSGTIDFEGFLRLITSKMVNQDPSEDIAKSFRLFDAEGQGKISLNDLKRVCAIVGENLTDEELQEMIDEADRNGDGVIDEHEFTRLMKRTNIL